MIPKIKDSRGRESHTLMFVAVSWLAVTMRYVASGFVDIPATTATEYGGAVGMILAIWLGREWTEKRNKVE